MTETNYTDHRSLVAQKKRDAMHVRILEATMAVFADRAHISPSIELVVRQADVSRGTFYKHFATLDEALVAAAQLLTDEMTIGMFPVYDVVDEPVNRVSTGMRLFLTRAAMDKTWAGFVYRAELVPTQSLLLKHLTDDLQRGERSGQFTFESQSAARDLVIGLTMEAMRGMVLGRIVDFRGYIDASISLVLRAFGVTPARCKEAVEFSRTHLMSWSADAAGCWTQHITSLENAAKRGRKAPAPPKARPAHASPSSPLTLTAANFSSKGRFPGK